MRFRNRWLGIGLLVVLLAFVAAPAYASDPPGLDRAIAAQERHTPDLMARDGVVGTAVGAGADGGAVVRIFTDRPGLRGFPVELDGVPVEVQVTGVIYALDHRRGHTSGPKDTEIDPTSRFKRPVPIGVSTGNENLCSAGTIGARVTDGFNVYALSNNHVYALENRAPLGSAVLQPGPFDTNCNARDRDAIGILWDFVPIDFLGGDNIVDAAIARSSTTDLARVTPSDGYGAPRASTVLAFLNQAVMKYGRTTKLTTGFVTAINATLNVSYSTGIARFVEQIIAENTTVFIMGGDSGSLLVEQGTRSPVGLLFAGGSMGQVGVANPIGAVLNTFSVQVDGL